MAKRAGPGLSARIAFFAAASGCTLGVIVLWLAADFLTFDHGLPDGIVSFISLHHYPKERDELLFYLALILLPVMSASCWWVATRVAGGSDSASREVSTGADPHAESHQKWGRTLLLFTSIFLYLLFLGRHHFGMGLKHDIDLFHEGARLAPLDSFLRGAVPFRDFFIPEGLITNLIEPWIAIKLLGISVAAVRIFFHLMAPLAYVAVFLLGTQLFDTKIGALSVPVLMLLRGYEVSDRYLIALLTLALVAAAIHRQAHGGLRKIFWLAATAGALTIFQIAWSLEIGLYVFAACFLVFFARSLQRPAPSSSSSIVLLPAYGLGLAAGAIPFTWYLASNHAISGFALNVFVQTRYHLRAWGVPYPPLLGDLTLILRSGLPVMEDLRYLASSYIPITFYLALGCALAVIWVSRRFQDRDYMLLLAWLAGAFALCTALGRSDTGHLQFSLPFFWIAACLLAERLLVDALGKLSRESWVDRSPAVILAFAALFAVPVFVIPADFHPIIVVPPPSRHPTTDRCFLTLSRAGKIRVSCHQAQQIMAVVSFLQAHTRPGEAIFDFSDQGAFFFLADRPSATRYQQIAYAVAPWMQLQVISDIERTQPRVVILRSLSKDRGWADSIDGIDNRDRDYLVADYLRTHFTKQVIVGETILLLKTDFRPSSGYGSSSTGS
ncbi:MAG TPA: hypothetical protein VIX12_09575 [Candidatus Binataceae bacterium]